MNNKKTHLPIYGVGPLYGIGIIAMTVIGIVLSCMGFLSAGRFPAFKVPLIVIGISIIAVGFLVWFKAAIRIDKYIIANALCTDGIYGIVRNPCYSGIMLMCTGALLTANNLFLLILPFTYWIVMTVLMKQTEEKWLYELYGEEYADYCKRVNRCIPWFVRKH